MNTDSAAAEVALEVMNQQQVADFLGRSRHTVRELSRRELNPLPSHRPGGEKGDRSFIKEEVLEWLRQQ